METVKDARQGDTAAMRKVMAGKEAEMLQILTPEQKFECNLRMAQTAALMRMQMGDFQPTEPQFRDMFKAPKAFDDEFGLAGMGSGNASKEERARRDTARKELTAQLQNILGEDGYRLYSYEKRWMDDPLNRIAKDNSMPKDTAFKVFDLQETAQAEAARVRANQALSAEKRIATLAYCDAKFQKSHAIKTTPQPPHPVVPPSGSTGRSGSAHCPRDQGPHPRPHDVARHLTIDHKGQPIMLRVRMNQTQLFGFECEW